MIKKYAPDWVDGESQEALEDFRDRAVDLFADLVLEFFRSPGIGTPLRS